MSSTTKPAEPLSATWLTRWEPEDPAFWSNGGSSIAWRTLALTTVNLTLAFAAWFLVSALGREGTWPIMLEVMAFLDRQKAARAEAEAEADAQARG